MPTTGVIDLSTCLVNQKLHMVIVHHFIREMLIGLVPCAFLGHYAVRTEGSERPQALSAPPP